MANGYVRQSSATISSGQPIASTPVNNEFNAIANAFSGSTGHDHSGGTGLGPNLVSSAIGISVAAQGLVVAQGGNSNPAGQFSEVAITGTANKIDVTNGNGVSGNPTLTISSTYVGQTSITTVGTISTGTWNGSILTSQYGGTGVNNGAYTITLGGNLSTAGQFTTTGAYNVSFGFSGPTSLTFPTTGTVATTAGGGSSTIVTVGSITTGTWQATPVAIAYGGTGGNLSSSGGAHQVVMQTTSGGNFSVAQLSANDLSNGVTGGGALVLTTSPTLVNASLGSSSVATTQSNNDNSTKLATTAYVANALSGLGTGSVTSVTGNNGLTGTVTTSGNIGLATIPNARIMANMSGSTAIPTGNTLTNILDVVLDNSQGDIITRGSSVWSALTPGSSGQLLQSGGAAANVSWSNTLGANTVLANGVTATTQAITDSSTKVATTAYVNNFANPASSLSGSGYQKLPGGVIIQWGSGSYSFNQSVAFPITFPNNAWCVVSTNQSTTNSSGWTIGSSIQDTGHFVVNLSNVGSGDNRYWIAIGN